MKKIYFLTGCLALLSIVATAQTKRYVKPTGTGDGSSWANASADLQAIINISAANDEVWVAVGTYKPTEKLLSSSTDARDVTFILKAGVKIYGGFAGSETLVTERISGTNETILSGDLNNSNTANIGDAYHVVASNGSSNGALLDGFTIQHGFADGGTTVIVNAARNQGGAINISNEETSITFKNLIIKNNQSSGTGNGGGGVYLKLNNSSNCRFENVVFDTNESVSASGGGMFFTSGTGSPTVVVLNSKLFSNKATGGAGLYVLGTTGNVPQLRLYNSIASENHATNTSTTAGAAVYCGTFSNTIIVNSTFYKNYSVNGAVSFNNSSGANLSIYNSLFNANRKGTAESTDPADIRNILGATLDLRSNLFQLNPIEDTAPEYNNTINASASPLFLSTTITDANFLKLVEGAATEKGDNSYITIYGLTTDLAGEVRVKHTNVDLGAYEYQGTLPVELESFTAKKVNTGVQLNWKIASEANNDRFVIERSADLVSFQELKTIPSKGDTQNTVTYNYTDYSPLNGNNYYRLSQVDKDGTVKILGTEVVNFDVSDIQVSAYPNPVTDYIKLKLNNLQNTSINVKLVSLLGQTLIAKRFESAFGKEISLDVRNINAGNYVLSIEALGKTQVVKMAIAR